MILKFYVGFFFFLKKLTTKYLEVVIFPYKLTHLNVVLKNDFYKLIPLFVV